MRVAHIVSTYPPYTGGMGNTCFNEVQELEKFGHTVVVFTPQYKRQNTKNKPRTRAPYQSKHGTGRASTVRGRNQNIVFLKPLFSVGNAACILPDTKKFKQFDIIHLHWPFIGGAEAILFSHLCKRSKSKLVVQYHMDLIAFGLRGMLFYIYTFLFNPLLVKSADAILVSSFDYVRNSHIKKYISRYSNKFIELPLGVDIEKFSPRPKNNKLREKYNLLSNDPIVLFVGGLDRAHYFKGLEVLLKAISHIKGKLPNVKCVIVGQGELKHKYTKMAKELGIGNNIIFTDRVENNKLPQYYNLADVFVLPSVTRSEAFGLVSLEAMACGKPIVVSNLPGPRILVKNNGLIADVNNSQDLGKKLVLLLKNQSMAQKFGKRGRTLVEKKYTWKEVGKRLNKMYHDIISSE